MVQLLLAEVAFAATPRAALTPSPVFAFCAVVFLLGGALFLGHFVAKREAPALRDAGRRRRSGHARTDSTGSVS